jgi:hypothetical protein
MTTRIPDLSATRLHFVVVCMHFDPADKAACAQSEKLGHLELRGLIQTTVGQQFLDLTLEPPGENEDGEPHLHLNLARSDWFAGGKTPSSGNIGQWDEIVKSFQGLSGRLYTQAAFQVPRDELPKDGLVSGLGQVTTEVAGFKVSLAGAELAIQGGQFRRIQWTVGKEWLRGEIRSVPSPGTISDSYVEESVRFLDDGINRIILARDTRD